MVAYFKAKRCSHFDLKLFNPLVHKLHNFAAFGANQVVVVVAFIVADLVALVLVFLIPAIAVFLPALME